MEDRLLWIETKCEKFSVKSLYKSLVSGHLVSFHSSAIWKVYVQPRVSFFWVGSNVGKGSYLGPTSKDRMAFSEQMLPLSKARRINRSHSSPLCVVVLSLGCSGAAGHS